MTSLSFISRRELSFFRENSKTFRHVLHYIAQLPDCPKSAQLKLLSLARQVQFFEENRKY